MRHRLLLAALLGTTFAACGGDNTNKIHPSIGVFDTKSSALDELDFGAVSLGKPKSASFSIHSLQQVPLTVSAISFEDDDGKSAPAYSVQTPDAFPLTIPAGGVSAASIALTPDDVRAFPARMVVHSDDPNHGEVRVKLTGLGIAGSLDLSACVAGGDSCKATAVEAPGPLDLGKVTQGDHEDAFVLLRNAGKDTLLVTSVDFADPAAAAAAGLTLSKGAGTASVPPGSSRSVTLTFAPTAVGKITASVVATTSDRDHPTLNMDIAAEGVPNGVPLACLYVKSVLRFRTGQTQVFTPDQQTQVGVVEPLDTVTLAPDARPGCSGDPEDGTAVTYAWVVEGPQKAMDTDPELVLRPERTGIYTISLAVKDHLGAVGTDDGQGNPAVLTLDVHPTTDIAVEVSWAGDAALDMPPGTDIDLDLHFLRNTLVAPFGNDDCRKPISESDSSCGLRWGSPTLTTDDPHHSPDDLGLGDLVETATLDSPESDKGYYLAVEYFNDRRQLTGAQSCSVDGDCSGDDPVCVDNTCRKPVFVKARVFIKGVDAGEIGPMRLDCPCDVWVAGLVDWTQKPPVLAPINTVQAAEMSGNVWGTPQGVSCLAPVQ